MLPIWSEPKICMVAIFWSSTELSGNTMGSLLGALITLGRLGRGALHLPMLKCWMWASPTYGPHCL